MKWKREKSQSRGTATKEHGGMYHLLSQDKECFHKKQETWLHREAEASKQNLKAGEAWLFHLGIKKMDGREVNKEASWRTSVTIQERSDNDPN